MNIKKPSLKGMKNCEYLGRFCKDEFIQQGHNMFRSGQVAAALKAASMPAAGPAVGAPAVAASPMARAVGAAAPQMVGAAPRRGGGMLSSVARRFRGGV